MKLSKTKKEQIERVVLDNKYGKLEESLDLEVKVFMTKEIKEILEKYDFSGLDDFLTFDRYVYLVDGKTKYNSDNYFSVKLDFKIPMYVGYRNDWSISAFDNPTAKKFINKKLKLQKQYNESREAIRGLLNSCTTDKQLLKTIPEIAPLIKDIINTSEVTALVSIETVEKVKSIL